MADSPSIVLASLSDDKLKESINSLVKHVNEKMEEMVESTNSAVKRMEDKLKSLGSLKIDSGGTNDGGTGRRTQQHEKLTKAVNDASEAVSKETQKLQDLQQSLSGASDREQNFISQKERAANTISQENELLKQQEQELSNLKSQQSSFGGASQQTTASIEKQREAVANLKNEVKYWQSIVSQIQSGDKKARFNSLWIGDTTSKQGHDILDVANKLYSIMQKLGMETEKGSASTGQAVKVVEQLAKYYKISREEAEKLVMSVQESPLARGKFTTHYDTRFGLDNLTMQKKDAEDSALRLLIAQSKLERQTDDLALANKRLSDSENSSTQASQQKAQIDAQVAAKEKEIAETKGRIAAATKEQSEADKNASQAAKEKANIQSQVANQEKQVAEAKKQLTTATQQHTDAETKSSRATKEKSMTLDQGQAAINTAIQSEKKYTEEIQKQAQAIRENKAFKEEGFVRIGNDVFYNNAFKQWKNVASVEEQILQVNREREIAQQRIVLQEQREKQEKIEAAQAALQQLGIERQITQEQEKRRRYKAPETYTGFDVSRDKLSGLIARRNGILPSQVVNWDEQTSSIKTLSAALKQYQEAYTRMSATERNSPFGKQMISDMHVLERELQKLRGDMSRMSKEQVFNLPTKTLDDIAYKMRQLSSYRSGLDVSRSSKEISQVNDEYNRLKKRMDEVMQKNQQMIASNTALGRSWNYMKNRLAFYFTVGASTQFIKQLVEVRSQYELLDRSIGILIDDARRGSAMFRELSEMALKSPFTLIELGSAAKQLVAYNIAAEDVVDTTRRLADMAAAVGLPIERLTYALGQVKAYGYLNSRDARIFLNAGIPIVQMLADMYNKQRDLDEEMVTAGQVREMMQKRLVSYSDVMKVVNEATDEGGRFFNFQEKAADTLKVRLANLNLAWNNLLNDMGKSEQGTIQTGIKGLTVLFQHWRELYRVIGTVAVAFGAYKTGALLASLATSQLTKNVVAAGTATKGLAVAIKSIPFAGWVSIIASVISYLFIFNDSLGDVGRRIQEITKDIEGFSKKMSDMYVKALSTDKLSDQLEELRNMINSFKNEFGVTIPVNLEDVNEGNIKAKIKEVKDRIDSYLAFTSVFTTTGAENERLKTSFDDFGNTANNVLNLITTNLSLVKQGLLETGKTAKDVEILDKKEGESTIAYLQRIVKLYEDLGLLGKVETRPYVGFNPLKSVEDNTDDLIERQEQSLTKLGIKNKEVFKNMMENAWDYYKSLSIAEYQFERFAKDLASKIDINSVVDKKERTLRVEAAIDKYTAQNGLNQTATELMKYLANQKFGVEIAVGLDPNAKKNTEEELQDWQKKLQQEADKNKIKLTIAFTSEQTPVSYAQEALTKVKDAMENVATLKRKKSAGTATQEDVDKATDSLKKLREQARLAGADLSSLDKKGGKGGSKKDVLGDALTKEVQLIGEIQKRFKEYQQIGVNAQDAIRLATEEYGNTLKRTNATLAKYGISTKTSEELADMDIRDVRDYYKSLLDMAKSTGNAKGIEAIEKALANINVEITKLDYKKITDSLNNELGRLKDEYELAVELDANPELGNMFAEMFGIDTSGLPKSIDEYMYRAQQEFDKKRAELHYDTPLDIFRASSEDWERWGKEVGLSEEALKSFNGKFVEAQGVAKKWAQDIVTNTKKLEYELADLDKKIAIKEQEQLDLQKRIDEESNIEQKHYLMLLYQNNEKAISELRAQALSLMPEYARVFNSIAEHSAGVARRLQQDLKRIFDTAKFDSSTNKWTLTSGNGKQTILDDKTYRKEREKLTREMRKSQSPFQKIKEAFKPSDKDGVVDYAKGIELLSGEVQKLGNVASEVGNLAQTFGADEQTVEIINDVATSLNGVATAGQGIAQIASGDYIGGAASVLSGVVSVIGAWADNSDKQISAEIKESELAVKRLELAYIDLEQAVNRAYGASVAGAKRATLANKELQLEEIKRQIQLEKSRDSKHRDEGRIIELQKQYKELMYEIQNGTREIVDDLLGTDAGSFAEDLVQSMIDAFRRGEDYMEVFEKKFETMVDNMIMKVIVSRVVSSYIDRIWDSLDKRLTARSEKEAKDLAEIQNKRAQIEDMSDEQVARIAGHTTFGWDSQTIHQWAEEYRNMLNEEEKAAQAAFDAATEIDNNDINFLLSEIARISPELAEKLKEAIGEWYHFGEDSQLSQLQQGLQGITESTASAVEAYLNGISQQCYLQSDLLTQIRDAVIGMDIDIQTATQAQMLLQLQNNYIVMQSMQSMMENWTVPSGSGIRVELMS